MSVWRELLASRVGSADCAPLFNMERIPVCAPKLPPRRLPTFPVPVSETVCVPTSSLRDRVAVRAPVAVGLNVTVIVQSAPGRRLDPQVDFALKSPGSVPSVMLLIPNDVLWSLVRITVSAFAVADRLLPIVDFQRQHADRLRGAVLHHGYEAGIEDRCPLRGCRC